MAGDDRQVHPPAPVPTVLLTVVVLLAGLLGYFFSRLLEVVDERWPAGRTVEVRQQAEALLPPNPGALFLDVRITQNIDQAYVECVVYRTTTDPPDVVAYYRRLFQRYGWAFYEPGIRGDSIHTVAGLTGTGSPAADAPSPVSPNPDRRVMLDLVPDTSLSPSYTLRVCSSSFSELLRGRPSESWRSQSFRAARAAYASE